MPGTQNSCGRRHAGAHRRRGQRRAAVVHAECRERPAVVRARDEHVELVAALRAVLVGPERARRRVAARAPADCGGRACRSPARSPALPTNGLSGGTLPSSRRRIDLAEVVSGLLHAVELHAVAERRVQEALRGRTRAARRCRRRGSSRRSRRKCPSRRAARAARAGRARSRASMRRRRDPSRRSRYSQWFSANFGCSATSFSPDATTACTAGTPAIGCGSSRPSCTSRSRPASSVTSMSPFGRNASPKGRTRSAVTTDTRIRCCAVRRSRDRRRAAATGVAARRAPLPVAAQHRRESPLGRARPATSPRPRAEESSGASRESPCTTITALMVV